MFELSTSLKDCHGGANSEKVEAAEQARSIRGVKAKQGEVVSKGLEEDATCAEEEDVHMS